MFKSPLPILAGCLLAGAAHAGDAAAQAPQCHYVKVAEMPLRYAGPELAPAVDGSINGKPATLVVDTGAWHSVMTMTGAVRRDMGLHWTGRRAYGFGGISRVYAARVQEIGIGDAHLTRRFDMEVIGDTASPPDFDALVGAPFLLQTDLELDLRAKRMALYRPRDCDKTELYLWEENTVAVPFKRTSREEVNPHFTVVVNGKALDAVIDSGAHRSVLTLAGAERAGIDVKSPQAVRLSDVGGVGSERAPHWSVPVASVQVGNETIRNVELGVVDAQSDMETDLFLGQDFLRAHRVLFAMKQEKLYIAYLGGDVFTRGTELEPWMRSEAEAGNRDAQYVLFRRYDSGRGAPRDRAAADDWLRKAAAAGQPNAAMLVARRDMRAGRYAEAVARLRAALDQLPADRYGALWLYLARLRTGEAELARGELEASLKRVDNDAWPYPIAQFYLGKWDAARLFAEAGKDQDKAEAQRLACMAVDYIDEWRAARGGDVRDDGALADARTRCKLQ